MKDDLHEVCKGHTYFSPIKSSIFTYQHYQEYDFS